MDTFTFMVETKVFDNEKKKNWTLMRNYSGSCNLYVVFITREKKLLTTT